MTGSKLPEPTTFIDTNVLVYAHDVSAGHKHHTAVYIVAELWRHGRPVVSTQVLQEFYVTITRKIQKPIDRAAARSLVSVYSGWPVHEIRTETIVAASELQDRHPFSFWDALILTAARVAGALRLYSEDMQHGQVIDGVRIENPFL